MYDENNDENMFMGMPLKMRQKRRKADSLSMNPNESFSDQRSIKLIKSPKMRQNSNKTSLKIQVKIFIKKFLFIKLIRSKNEVEGKFD